LESVGRRFEYILHEWKGGRCFRIMNKTMNLKLFACGCAHVLFLIATCYKITPYFMLPPFFFFALAMVILPFGAFLSQNKWFSNPAHISFVLSILFLTFLFLPVFIIRSTIGPTGSVFFHWLLIGVWLVPILLMAGALEFLLFNRIARDYSGFHLPYLVLTLVSLAAALSGMYLPQWFGLSLLGLATLTLSAGFVLLAGGSRWIVTATAVAALVTAIFFNENKLLVRKTAKTGKNGSSLLVRSRDETSGRNQLHEILFSEWGRNGHFMLTGDPKTKRMSGWYYGLPIWDTAIPGKPAEGLDRIAFQLAQDRNLPIAIIGSGGGRETTPALATGFQNIFAIDIERAIPRAFQVAQKAGYSSPYVSDRIRFVSADGRSWLARQNDHRLGLIMMAEAGNYPFYVQNALSPGTWLHTKEAFSLYRKKLAPDGVFALTAYKFMPAWKSFVHECLANIEAAGLSGFALEDRERFLVIGVQRENRRKIKQDIIRLAKDSSEQPIAWNQSVYGRVTTDAMLYSAMSYVVSYKKLMRISFVVIVLLLGLTVFAAVILYPRSGFTKGKAYAGRVGMAILTGIAYYILQVLLIARLYRLLHDLFQSIFMGLSVFFLLFALANLVYLKLSHRWKIRLFYSLLVAATFLSLMDQAIPALLCSVLLCSGLFPALFGESDRIRFHIYAFDSLGGAMGAVLGVLIPYGLGVDLSRLFLLATMGVIVLGLHVMHKTSVSTEIIANTNSDV